MNARTFPGDWREPREPYTGPHTGQELSWLEVLEETEARQGRVAFAAVLPAYDGPVTGELERVPGEPGPAGGALQRHRARFTVFSAVGAAVLVAGVAVQALLIAAHAGRYGSYAGQAVFSIEASFALNWLVTWRDRKSPFRAACWRFNVQKLALTVPNFALYALLVRLGAGWLAANLAVTAVFTAANYVLGDQWAFTAARAVRRGRGGQALPPVTPLPPWWQPPVSAVIPCKGNEATILATVQSLLAQDYPGLTEVILVGDVGDSTWAALAGVRDPRLRLLEQEKTPGRRDPNVKRDKGARAASGEVLALADSDIVMDPGWLSRAVGLLREQGGGLVGGGMRAIKPHLFWPRFVDNNVLAAKTSRIPRAYQVTAANFGHRHRKPPVTANAVLTRAAYDACPLDTAWAYGYEDYEWMHRLTAGGCTVTMDPGLTGDHHHREKFAHLIREYRRSAHGCAQFVRRHPGSALAGKRRAQAIGLPLAAATALAAGIAAAAAGHALAVLALAIGTIAVLSGREALRSRSVIGAVYPAAALALGGVFTWTLAGNLLKPGSSERAAPAWNSADREASGPREAGRRHWLLAVILMVQALFSGSLIWSNTAFGDEALYLWAGRTEWAHWLHGAPLIAGFSTYFSGAPDIYPPIGAAAAAAGGLAGARILSLAFMLAATALLYAAGVRLFGRVAALWAAALWAVSEPVLRLAFATYDPLACSLVVAAGYLAVRAADSSKRRGELIAASGILLGAAGLTAISFAIYIPAVASVSLCVLAARSGWAKAAAAAAWQAAVSCAVFFMGMTAMKMWHALSIDAVNRTSGTGQGISLVFRAAWSWDGILICIAVTGVLAGFRQFGSRSPESWLLVTLAACGVLVPLYQAHIGTAFSMDKHMSAGTAFAALAAGYAVSRFRVGSIRGGAAVLASAVLLAFPAVTGLWYARATFQDWPAASGAVAAASRYLGSGPALVNSVSGDFNVSIFQFYDPSGNWEDNNPRMLQEVASGGYSEVIQELDAAKLTEAPITGTALTHSSELDRQVLAAAGNVKLVAALEASRRYAVADIIPYATANSADSAGIFVIWRRIPVPAVRHAAPHRPRRRS